MQGNQLMKETVYTVIYINDSSNECTSVTIPSSSCSNRICSHNFDVYASPCSRTTEINVRVITTQMDDTYDITTVTGIGNVISK